MSGPSMFRPRKQPYRKNPRSAPGEIEIFRRFVATSKLGKRDREELTSPENLGRWLAGQGLLATDVELTEDDLHRALELRTAMRDLVKAGKNVPEALVERFERVSAGLRFSMAFDSAGVARYEPLPGEPGEALGALLALFDRIRRDPVSWPRVKVCGNCGGVFYDYTRSQNGKWCRPGCGARVRGIKMKNRRRRRVRAYQPIRSGTRSGNT
jgi:predicted RNA-binding Zn ribbon-like protein